MNKVLFFILTLIPSMVFSQDGAVQDGSIPKDAPINVVVTDFKNNSRPNEIIVFKSQANSREYQGLTDDNG